MVFPRLIRHVIAAIKSMPQTTVRMLDHQVCHDRGSVCDAVTDGRASPPVMPHHPCGDAADHHCLDYRLGKLRQTG